MTARRPGRPARELGEPVAGWRLGVALLLLGLGALVLVALAIAGRP